MLVHKWISDGVQPIQTSSLKPTRATHPVSHQQDIATALGLTSPPTKMWPALNDPRVAAVVAMAPDGDIWGLSMRAWQLSNAGVILGGSDDTINLPERTTDPNL